MRIESGIPETSRVIQVKTDASTAASLKVQNTSEPEGGKSQATRFDTISVGDQPNVATVQKPVDVKEAIEKLNKFVQSQKKYVNFSVDEATHSTVIKIFKTETGELIKQFPAEEILAMAAKIRESIGWLYDSKV